MLSKTKLTSVYLFILIICTASSTPAASYDGLTGVETAQVPCYIKIAAGGELVVAIDIDRKAELAVKNAADESEFTVTEYRNGKQRKGSQVETSKLDKNEYRKSWQFNKYFDQTPKLSVVDEIRIVVKKGAVYAEVGQTGTHRIDFYNNGYQRGTTVNLKTSLSVRITGDNQSGGQTSGNLILESETGNGQQKIPFTIEKGKTLRWDYPVEKEINSVEVDITEGQAKVSLFQPSDYKAAEPVKTKAKTAAQTKETSKTAEKSPTAKAGKSEAKSSKTATKEISSDTILNGQVPLMEGANVLLDMSLGSNGKVNFEVSASPDEVVSFYKEAMLARGWKSPDAKVQGAMGILKISKGTSAFTMIVQGTAQKSVVNIGLTQ